MNKYDQIKIDSLIKCIQDEMPKLQDPMAKKKMSATLFSRKIKDVNEMRWSVTERLRKMDRERPDFFPIGIYVEYFPEMGRNEKGIVMGRDDRTVFIKLINQSYQIKVEPKLLNIMYLR